MVAEGDALTKVPGAAAAPGGASLPAEVAAVSVGAPLTAKALVESFSALSGGDVIVQNGAGGIVGQAVIQAAAARGVRTVNILPGRPGDWAEVVYHLQGLGATIVVDEAFARTPAFRKLLADLPPPKLGLDAVGGGAAAAVARALGTGATLVTYGGRPRAPLRLSSSLFTAKGLTLRGQSPAAAVAGGGGGKAARDAAVLAAVEDVRGGDGAWHTRRGVGGRPEREASAVAQGAQRRAPRYAPTHAGGPAPTAAPPPTARSRPHNQPAHAAARVKLLIAREPFADFDVALERALEDAGDRTVVLTMPK